MKIQILNNRNILSVSGKDKATFLQGLITNDINKLENGKMLYSLMLNPQGRFLYDFFIKSHEDKILIDHEANFTKEIITKLNLYKLRSDVHIEDYSGKYKIISTNKSLDERSCKDPRDDRLGFRSYVSDVDNIGEISSRYDELIYEYTIPEPHKDMVRERSFPLEFGLDEFNAISFDKGCYMGQENTARTKHRGTVRKKLVKFLSAEEISGLEIGEEIFSNDKKVGNFCSSLGKVGKVLIRIAEYEAHGKMELEVSGYKIKII
jgi:hypothetical protein